MQDRLKRARKFNEELCVHSSIKTHIRENPL